MRNVILAAACFIALGACTTNEQRIAGAATGAGAGALIGGPIGAIAGGAVGAIAGPSVTGSINKASQ